MKTITIPANVMNPYVVDINGMKYSYAAGSTVSVPDEVAEAITNALRLSPRENPPVEGSVMTFSGNAGTWEVPKGVDAAPAQGSEFTVSSGGVWQAIEDAKVTDAQLKEATEDVLEDHPEWTTTVEDGSITTAKLHADVIDDTLAVSGAAADAKVTGAKISDNRDINDGTLGVIKSQNWWKNDTYSLAPTPSATNSSCIGVKQNKNVITLSGTNTVSGDHKMRIVLSGQVKRQLGNVTTPDEVALFNLTPGHRYSVEIKNISGSYSYSGTGSVFSLFIKYNNSSDSYNFALLSSSTLKKETVMIRDEPLVMYLFFDKQGATYNDYCFSINIVDMGVDDETENAFRKSIIGCSQITNWVYGKSVAVDTQYSSDNIVTNHSYRYSLSECAPNDTFTVCLNSSETYAGYAFLDSSYNVIKKASAAISERKNLRLIAPENSAYILLQTTYFSDYSFYPCYVGGDISMLRNDVSALTNRCCSDTIGMKIMAHRGYNEAAPQGSILAYKNACIKGAYGLNMAQIRLSADNTFWVFHDENVSDTTDGTGNVGELTDEYLSSLQINGSQYSSDDRKIPTLDDLIYLCLEYGCKPMLRFARQDTSGGLPVTYNGSWEDLFAKIYAFGIENDVMFSGSIGQLALIDKYFPYSRKVYYLNSTSTIPEILVDIHKASWKHNETMYAMVSPSALNDSDVSTIRAEGFKLYSWAITAETRKSCADYKCEFINADSYPGLETGTYHITNNQLAYELLNS